jgi:hypothetical protein
MHLHARARTHTRTRTHAHARTHMRARTRAKRARGGSWPTSPEGGGALRCSRGVSAADERSGPRRPLLFIAPRPRRFVCLFVCLLAHAPVGRAAHGRRTYVDARRSPLRLWTPPARTNRGQTHVRTVRAGAPVLGRPQHTPVLSCAPVRPPLRSPSAHHSATHVGRVLYPSSPSLRRVVLRRSERESVRTRACAGVPAASADSSRRAAPRRLH